MAYAAWLEVRLMDRRKTPTELPVEIAEKPGGLQGWLDSLKLPRKQRDVDLDTDEEDEDDELEVEEVPRWKQQGRSKPNWVTNPPWWTEHLHHRSAGVYSDSKPHESYGEIAVPSVIAGLLTETPFSWDRYAAQSVNYETSDYSAFRFSPGAAKRDFTQKDPDDLEEILSDFLGEEDPVEGSLKDPFVIADSTEPPIYSSAEGTLPPTISYSGRYVTSDFDDRLFSLLGRALVGKMVRLDKHYGIVLGYQPENEPTAVMVQSGGRTEYWAMTQLELVARPPEVDGQQEISPADPAPEPPAITESKLDRKAFAKWKREDLPWLVEQIDLGYKLSSNAFRGLNDEQMGELLKKRPKAV